MPYKSASRLARLRENQTGFIAAVALRVIVWFDVVVRFALLVVCGLFVCNFEVRVYCDDVARPQKANWH